jgi:proteasome alpha subunit
MQGRDQQAYDRGTSIFSPDGRLYQVEYAREAVTRGSASVGLVTDAGAVLAANGRRRSPLLDPDSVEKLHVVDDHVGVASAGHAADARRLVDQARERAQVERLRYDEPVPVPTLAKALADHVQETTQQGGSRPYGAAVLVAGVDDDGAHCYEVDPSGTPYGWQATAVGAGRDARLDLLEDAYDDPATLEDGVALALRALAADADAALDPGDAQVATVDVDEGRYRRLDRSTVADHLDDLDDRQAS